MAQTRDSGPRGGQRSPQESLPGFRGKTLSPLHSHTFDPNSTLHLAAPFSLPNNPSRRSRWWCSVRLKESLGFSLSTCVSQIYHCHPCFPNYPEKGFGISVSFQDPTAALSAALSIKHYLRFHSSLQLSAHLPRPVTSQGYAASTSCLNHTLDLSQNALSSSRDLDTCFLLLC